MASMFSTCSQQLLSLWSKEYFQDEAEFTFNTALCQDLLKNELKEAHLPTFIFKAVNARNNTARLTQELQRSDSLIFTLLTCLDTFLNKHRRDGVCFHLRCGSVINVSSCYWAPRIFPCSYITPTPSHMSGGVWEICKLRFKNKPCVATVEKSPSVFRLFFNFAFTTREPFKSFSLRESDCASVVLAGLYRCALLYIKKGERHRLPSFL